MKIFFATLALFSVLCAQAEERDSLKLESVSISIGKGALTSGYDVSINFRSSVNGLQVTGNHSRTYVVYRWYIPVLTIGASGGFFKNAPWVGPQILFEPCSFLSTMHWLGVVAGAPEKPSWETNVIFNYHGANVHIGPFSASYAIQKFMFDPWNQVPGVNYKLKVNSSWAISVNVDYDTNNREPLFQIALKHAF